MYFDTHAHLYMLENSTCEEVVQKSSQAKVTHMTTVSVDEASWEKNKNHAHQFENIYYSIGIHPHDANTWQACKDKLAEWLKQKDPKLKAIGETGLDYFYNHSTREEQISSFEDQVILANENNLPLIIHCREAFKDLFASLDKKNKSKQPGVMHCFTGTYAEAKESLDRGFYISFSGILTFPKATELHETAKKIPLDRIVIETDCPFLAPVPHRGKKNEPSFLPHTALKLAELKNVPVAEVASQTFQNAIELFHI